MTHRFSQREAQITRAPRHRTDAPQVHRTTGRSVPRMDSRAAIVSERQQRAHSIVAHNQACPDQHGEQGTLQPAAPSTVDRYGVGA